MSYTQPQPALPMVSGNRWAMVLRGIAAVLFVGNWVSGTRKEKMNRNYAALRLWSTVLTIIGVAGVILVVIGTVFAMIEAVTFLQALAILLIGGPLAALFASCEKRGREFDGVSDDPVSLFVGDYESAEAAKADLQKLEQLHHKGTEGPSALFDAALSEPWRAE
jgi:hypothetical protein